MTDPINYSHTQRILLFIDLHPTLITLNPKPYLHAIRIASQSILTFPSLSTSLFSFQFFYSSLPLLFYPVKPPLSLRFDEPAATLKALSVALNSLDGVEKKMDEMERDCCKAEFVDMALRQVLHGYKWEKVDKDLEAGVDFVSVRSNLVLVMSPVGRLNKFAKEFVGLEEGGEVLGSVDSFIGRFRDAFEHVRNLYLRNDMHLAWIDVKTASQCTNCDEVDKSEFGNELFRNGVDSLGWGFCSTDSLVLGAALVPIGLIYPLIGLACNVRKYDSSSKKYRAQLNLEISDVNGKPLECRFADMELIETNLLPRSKSELIAANEVSGKSIFDNICKGTSKLRIQAVMKYSEFANMNSRLTKIILVTANARKYRKDEVKVSGEFYADKVLKKLRSEMGRSREANSPLWNILLSYLYKESHWGLVSLTNGDGSSFTGILKPFTFEFALLFVVDSLSWPQTEVGELKLIDSVKDADVNSHIGDEEPATKETTVPLSQDGDTGRKKTRLLKSLNWGAFCKMAYESFRADISDAYFTSSTDKSKKLKFFKCWMKQIKKCSPNYFVTFQPEQHPTPKEFNDRLLQSLEGELPISSPISFGENSISDIERTQEADVGGLISETPECFLNSLTKRIQDGLENESLDLGAFSERIVKSTFQSLLTKLASEGASQTETNEDLDADSLSIKIVRDMKNLLLIDPKDLNTKHNNTENSKAVDPCPVNANSEAIKRRCELQILFRMEIIRSEVAPYISESMKHKFVKQICMLLERIQCHLEGGFLGDWNLGSYLAKLLKTRYSHDQEYILHQIYSKMDLLLFSEEDENLDLLLNSEDSSQSFKERPFGEINLILEPASAENKTRKQLKSRSLSLERNNSSSHILKLVKAQEQRERARRFSSFTSWIPDLQRVWAPKQLSQPHSQFDVSRKHSKRPSRQCASLDMVFETPESNKKSCSRRSVDSPCSVSKALFQNSQ